MTDTAPERIWAITDTDSTPEVVPQFGDWIADNIWPEDTTIEYVRADLADTRHVVKPLEWVEHRNGYWFAETEFGTYEAGWDDGVWAQLDGPSMWDWKAETDPRGLTVQAARNACKADHERRILSCLNQPKDTHPDDLAVDRFATAMKAKLRHAREVKGKAGWDTSDCSDKFLANELIGHLIKGNSGTFEDVANFAMMLHQRNASPHELAKAYYQAQAYVAHTPDTPSVQEAAKVLLEELSENPLDWVGPKIAAVKAYLEVSSPAKPAALMAGVKAALLNLAQEGE